jgi:hypothetical protein
VNMGLIKSVRPEIDLTKIDKQSEFVDAPQELCEQKKHFHVRADNLEVKLKCDFCGGRCTAGRLS